MSFERSMDPADDPERRAAIARERGQLDLPFSESVRPDVKESVKETVRAVHEAIDRIRDTTSPDSEGRG